MRPGVSGTTLLGILLGWVSLCVPATAATWRAGISDAPLAIDSFTYPPRYHAAGQDSWDFWYGRNGDTFYAFYLQSPANFANSTIGVATSKDQIHWTEYGEILHANPPGQWNDAWVATGSVWGYPGDWKMLYTGQTYSFERGYGLATSPDLLHWTKVGTGPVQMNYQPFVVPTSPYWQGKGFVAGTTLSHLALADPYVLPEPIDGWLYMVANSLLDQEPDETRGCVTLWRSQDGYVWEDLGIIVAPRIYDQLEAPQLWKRGDRWYLLFGAARQNPVYRATMVFTAPTMYGPFEPSPASEITLFDTSDWFYVAKVTPNAYGQDILLGGLGGTLSHPYSVLYEPDGSLRVGAYESSFPQWTLGGVTGYLGPLVSDAAGGVIVKGERRFNPNGAQLWAQTSGRPGAPWASDGRGGAVGTTIASTDVYGMRVSHNGTLPWGTSVLVCGATGTQQTPVVASDVLGGALFAWVDPRGGVAAQDIYVQRVDSAGVVKWTADGVAACTAGGIQDAPAIVSDGSGGAIVAWRDARGGAAGGTDLYAQRIDATGTTRWTANGVAVCAAAGAQDAPVIESDGAGGAWIAWGDARTGTRDVHVQRLSGNGTPALVTDGALVGGGLNDQLLPAIARDGAGGLFVAWEDHRAGGIEGIDLYAQRLSPAGTALWTANGAPISAGPGRQIKPALIADGAGGCVTAWMDSRDNTSGTTTYFLPYAQRVDAGGASRWTAGGVRVEVTGTGTASPATPSIAGDGAGGVFLIAAAGIHRVLGDGRPGWMEAWGPTIPSVTDVPNDGGGVVQITIAAPYAQIAPFTPAISQYQVWRKVDPPAAESRRADGIPGAPSGAAPAAPAAAPPVGWESVGSFAPTGAWTYTVTAPTRADSSGAGFAREEFTITATIASPSFLVAGNSLTGYSVDNVTPIEPDPTTDVPPPGGPATFVDRFVPNPVRASSSIKYGLAQAGPVALAIYDLHGRRVRTLVDGEGVPGVWRARWDGADDLGRRVPAGIYLARFAAAGIQRTTKIVVAR